GADGMDDGLPVRPWRAAASHGPVPQVGILHVQQLVEGLARGAVGRGPALGQPPAVQGIQLPGAAAATPAQALEACFVVHGKVCRAPQRRAAMAFLISAMAVAGLRPLGQVRAQFMMVWQRYSLNGSSRSSRRAPVSSSRLSEIQRYAWSRTAGPR